MTKKLQLYDALMIIDVWYLIYLNFFKIQYVKYCEKISLNLGRKILNVIFHLNVIITEHRYYSILSKTHHFSLPVTIITDQKRGHQDLFLCFMLSVQPNGRSVNRRRISTIRDCIFDTISFSKHECKQVLYVFQSRNRA